MSRRTTSGGSTAMRSTAERSRAPYPHGDRFMLYFKYDVTPKQAGQRITIEETGLYTVQHGKIVKEEFFYSM
jgi:hypothetical protein